MVHRFLRGAALAAIVVLSAFDSSLARTLRVPSEDYPTIQSGLDKALAGDTVLVAPGTYTGFGNRDLSFATRAIVLRSEAGSEATIIDVAASRSEPGRGIAFLGSEPPEAVFEGFTIENGYISIGLAEKYDAAAPGRFGGATNSTQRHKLSGGGVTIQWFSSPTLRDIVVRNCHSDFTGGGFSVETYSRPELSGCIALGCTANLQGGGLSIETFTVVRLVDCAFTGNSAPRGGGISISQADATLERCTIAGNQSDEGGGLWMGFPAELGLQQVIVWGNCSPNPGADVVMAFSTHAVWTCSIVDSAMVFTEGVAEYDSATSSSDPSFCNPRPCAENSTVEGDYGLNANSPASSDYSACGLRIGAFEVMCEPPPATIESTWGGIKARFSSR